MLSIKRNSGEWYASMIAVGIGIGTAIGATTDNIGLWLALGPAIGMGLHFLLAVSVRSPKDPQSRKLGPRRGTR